MINRRFLLIASGSLVAIPQIAKADAPLVPSDTPPRTSPSYIRSEIPDIYQALNTAVQEFTAAGRYRSPCRLTVSSDRLLPSSLLPNGSWIERSRRVPIRIEADSNLERSFTQAFRTLFNNMENDINTWGAKSLATCLPATRWNDDDDAVIIVDPLSGIAFEVALNHQFKVRIYDVKLSWAIGA